MADFQQNFLASLHGGTDFGQRMKGIGDQSKLNQLAAQSYSTPPDQRDSLLAQMAGVDAGAAFQAEKQMAYSDERRNTNMVNMAKLLTNAPPQARAGLYRSMVPTLSRFGLSEMPQEYNDQTAPMIDQAAQSIVQAYQGQGGGGVQSTYVDGDGNRVAIMRDGSSRVLGRNDAGATQQTIEVDVNGVPTRYTFDRRTARYTPAVVGGGQQSTQLGPQRQDMEADVDLANSMIAAGIPEAQVDAFLSQRGQRTGSAPAAPTGAPLVGRRKEDEARAVAQAQADVELSNLPTELNMRTDAALREAGGKASIETGAKRQAVQAENDRSFNLYDTAMRGVSDGLSGASTGPIVGRLPALTADQQIAEGGVSAIAPVLKQMFRTAGEGTFTDKDQDLLMSMIPTRTDLPKARDWKIENIDRIVREKLGQPAKGSVVGEQGGGGREAGMSAIRINSVDDYNQLPSGTIYISPDGMQRRKR